MIKKIFALVMVISVLGAMVAGCKKGEDSADAGATGGASAGATAGK